MCRLKKIRNRKAASQSWSCYYCEQPIWKDNPVAFAAKHNITIRQARLLQTTAEHLVPRGEGGLDSDTNIVAACFYRSEEHTSELQSLMRISYAVFCLKKKKKNKNKTIKRNI